jgi:lipoprotein-anchoring transpeptidase ErfK/SrfK
MAPAHQSLGFYRTPLARRAIHAQKRRVWPAFRGKGILVTMTYRFTQFVLCLGGLMALGACVPDAQMAATSPPVETPTIAPGAEEVYVARNDGTYTIPAIPVTEVPVQYQRQIVPFETIEPAGTIIINPAARQLHLILGKGKALRYGISVGRAGFEWSGEAIVASRKPWPTWTPPPEMIERDPKLEKWKDGQPGGPDNPLGARALYLTTKGRDYGYRIHGTPDWRSIGRNASSGCIRMINQDVIDLYNRVPDSAKVIVLTRNGKLPSGLTLPPPTPKKTKAKPAETVAAAETVPAGPISGPF